jgi:hypothetical protein
VEFWIAVGWWEAVLYEQSLIIKIDSLVKTATRWIEVDNLDVLAGWPWREALPFEHHRSGIDYRGLEI